MARGKPIIVCSMSQSKTSNDVVDIIQQLCPGEEVTFQLAQKGNRFDGRKVVFCHSSLDGRLALTDVNDSIYDKAITDACRIVGKANVTFIVTNVSAANVNLKRRMIKESQPTVISNIGMLLLVDKFDVVDHGDQDNINKLRDFLKVADRPNPIYHPNQPPIGPLVPPPIQPPIHPPANRFLFITIFLQLIVMMLCLAFVYIHTKQADMRQSEVNHVLNGLKNEVQTLENTLKVKIQSIGETVIENTTFQFTNGFANISKRIAVIESQLKKNESEQPNLKSQENYNIKAMHALNNYANQQSRVEWKIHEMNSTVLHLNNTLNDIAKNTISMAGKIDKMNKNVIDHLSSIPTGVNDLPLGHCDQRQGGHSKHSCTFSECSKHVTLWAYFWSLLGHPPSD